ncbi:hypothetical protein [Granulicella sibirica]|uniref:hypothetical protein n=1 Tax=Granulicella sibirica TaxID=2479048 RepID=UPI00100881C8|nr:hypothetical protein [Granulicella sibirica]
MPHPMSIAEFRDLIEHVDGLDVSKVTKPELGTLGLPVLAEAIVQVRKEIGAISSVASESSQQRLEAATSAYRQYLTTLYDIASLRGEEFATRRSEFGGPLAAQWDAIREVWPYFAALVTDKSGLVEAPNSAIAKIEAARAQSEDSIRTIVSSLTEQATKQASKIEENARKTATGFSVRAAQDQFDQASVSLARKATAWGLLALLAFGCFVEFAFQIYRNPPSVFTDKSVGHIASIPEAIYLTAIRITLLTAIGAFATFCVKMLRAHLHMSEFNNHRRRVANSMAAFVEATQTPEQRDLIFGKLVDAVVNFGDSGLLEKDSESLGVPSIAFEAITKNLTSKS